MLWDVGNRCHGKALFIDDCWPASCSFVPGKVQDLTYSLVLCLTLDKVGSSKISQLSSADS